MSFRFIMAAAVGGLAVFAAACGSSSKNSSTNTPGTSTSTASEVARSRLVHALLNHNDFVTIR